MPKDLKQRAQIFQSFDALKGFREILRETERVIVPRKVLSEDDLDMLDRKIKMIKNGMIIKIIYYYNGQYIQLEGKVSKINLNTRFLQIVKTKINLKDVVDIKSDDFPDIFDEII